MQVDMKQHTESHALAVLALRPAPVHLAWLGFPGGAGGGLCDGLVGDPALPLPPRLSLFSHLSLSRSCLFRPSPVSLFSPSPSLFLSSLPHLASLSSLVSRLLRSSPSSLPSPLSSLLAPILPLSPR